MRFASQLTVSVPNADVPATPVTEIVPADEELIITGSVSINGGSF